MKLSIELDLSQIARTSSALDTCTNVDDLQVLFNNIYEVGVAMRDAEYQARELGVTLVEPPAHVCPCE